MIYFAKAADKKGDLVKIGTAKSVARRVVTLGHELRCQIGIHGIMQGGHAEESALHDRFSYLRQEGEWFLPGQDLVDFIDKNTTPWDGNTESGCITFRCHPEMVSIIDSIATENRHTRSVTIAILVEEALKARGRLPKK